MNLFFGLRRNSLQSRFVDVARLCVVSKAARQCGGLTARRFCTFDQFDDHRVTSAFRWPVFIGQRSWSQALFRRRIAAAAVRRGLLPRMAGGARAMVEVRPTWPEIAVDVSGVRTQRHDHLTKAMTSHAVQKEVDGVVDEHELVADGLRYLQYRDKYQSSL